MAGKDIFGRYDDCYEESSRFSLGETYQINWKSRKVIGEGIEVEEINEE
jgi:hypothetical protein